MAGLTPDDTDLLRSFGLTELPEAVGPGKVAGDLESAIVIWFAAFMGPDAAGEDGLARSRVAWLSIDGPAHWSQAFLAANPPASLAGALRAAWPEPVPREMPRSMPERPLHGERDRPGIGGRLLAFLRQAGRRSQATVR